MSKLNLKGELLDVAFRVTMTGWLGFWILGKALGFIKYEWLEVLFVAFAPFIVAIAVVIILVFVYLFYYYIKHEKTE